MDIVNKRYRQKSIRRPRQTEDDNVDDEEDFEEANDISDNDVDDGDDDDDGEEETSPVQARRVRENSQEDIAFKPRGSYLKEIIKSNSSLDKDHERQEKIFSGNQGTHKSELRENNPTVSKS